jgi:hypothetical protein
LVLVVLAPLVTRAKSTPSCGTCHPPEPSPVLVALAVVVLTQCH